MGAQVGRKVVMEGTSEEKQSEQERAAAAAKAADEAALLTMREFNEGGGRAAPAARALAASKRVEVDPRIKVRASLPHHSNSTAAAQTVQHS